MKLTPWLPPDVLPVHEGVYETRLTAMGSKFSIPGYSHWAPAKDGRGGLWGEQRATPQRAWQDRRVGVQWKPWRGLTRPAA
jgi:hypothetical protein